MTPSVKILWGSKIKYFQGSTSNWRKGSVHTGFSSFTLAEISASMLGVQFIVAESSASLREVQLVFAGVFYAWFLIYFYLVCSLTTGVPKKMNIKGRGYIAEQLHHF